MENSDETNARPNEFYTDAADYWAKVPATIDGMLGGFGFISHTDIDGSEFFLKSLFKLPHPPGKAYALDCGAGIGRITKNLLTKHFKRVDLVEQNPKFLETAKTYLETCGKKIGELFPLGLQDFSPTAGKYDVIWCQWVLGHLQDDDLINFFHNCQTGLKENGIVVVKENITSSDKVEVDTEDSSMTRPINELQHLFRRAGFICLKEQKQSKLPRGLYPVHMFALRPKRDITTTPDISSLESVQ